MKMTLRQFHLFRTFVSTGNISGAAKEANLTQPIASVRLRDLSEAMGLPEAIGCNVFLKKGS